MWGSSRWLDERVCAAAVCVESPDLSPLVHDSIIPSAAVEYYKLYLYKATHLEEPHVSAQRGHKRVCSMEHQRERSGAVRLTACRVYLAAAPRAHCLGPLRAEGASDNADVGCCLFQQVPAFQHACYAIACRRGSRCVQRACQFCARACAEG